MMNIEELAKRIGDMDETQITEALQDCTATQLTRLTQLLGIKISGSKHKKITVIAKTFGFKELTRRIGQRPFAGNTRI